MNEDIILAPSGILSFAFLMYIVLSRYNVKVIVVYNPGLCY